MKPLISISTLLIVLLLVLLETQSTSPGPLSAVHSQNESLQATKNCAVCHGSGDIDLKAACLECHEPIELQLTSGGGFHGSLDGPIAEDCNRCHGEHLGPDFNPGSNFSFLLAGIADANDFDHEMFDWSLAGAHERQDCEGCHPNANTNHLELGETRFLGLDQNCTTCHEDVHEDLYGQSCAECHGQDSPFDRVANFEHDPRYPLLGAHSTIACVDCHDPDSQHAIGTLVLGEERSNPDFSQRTSCRDCHQDSHTTDFLFGVAQAVGRSIEQSCTHCHRAQFESFRGDAVTMTDALHSHSGFVIEGPHQDVTCAECHKGFGDSESSETYFAQAFPGRTQERCGDCHDDPHQETFGSSCTDCHGVNDAFENVTAFKHHPNYPLEDSHAEVACDACHDPESEYSVRALRELAQSGQAPQVARSSCSICHTDPHSTAFIAEAASELFVTEANSCEVCHDISHDSFRGNLDGITEALHNGTGFPLEPPHAELECAACHTGFDGQHERSEHVRNESFAERFPGRTREKCEACHEDPHQAQFAEGPFASGCLECHAPLAFVPTQFDIELHERTRFPLIGSHTAVGCTACHKLEHEGIFSAVPNECSACHEDPHDARFERADLPISIEGRLECARCHTSNSFDEIIEGSFEHTFWTGFELEGQHAKAECRACHIPTAELFIRGLSFGPVAGQKCADCHNDVHLRQFEKQSETDCARCHSASQDSFVATKFDHQIDSRFKLDETHIDLACSTCHQSFELPNGSFVTRYLPLGTECVDCHDPGSLDR